MENNSYTNKEKALSLFKWSLKRFKAIIIAYTILMFVIFPMIEIISYIIQGTTGQGNYAKNMIEAAPALALASITTVSLLFSTIFAVISFSYLQSKRRVDLFGSFPVSRRTLFFVRYAAALVASIVPMIVIFIVGGALSMSLAGFGGTFKVFAVSVLGVVGNISMVAFLSVCCGTVVDVIISYGVINAVFPILVTIICLFPKHMIPGYMTDNIKSAAYTLFTPLAAPYNTLYGTGNIFAIVWWIGFSLVMTAVCYKLCKIRKAEVAQTAFAFNAVEYIIKAISITTAGFGAGWLFSYIGDSYDNSRVMQEYIWFVVGLVIIAMVVNLLLHLVYHRGLSEYKSSLKICAGSICMSLIFALVIGSGMFGFDTRVPEASKVDEIKVRSYSYRSDFTVDGENLMFSTLREQNQIKDFISIHQSTVEGVAQHKVNGLYPLTGIRGVYDDDYDYVYGGYAVEYKLNNGKTIKRTYTTAYGKDEEAMKKLALYTSTDMAAISNIPAKYVSDITIQDVSEYSSWEDYSARNVDDNTIVEMDDDKDKNIEEVAGALKKALMKDIASDKIYTQDYAGDDNSDMSNYEYLLDIYFSNSYKEFGIVRTCETSASLCIPKTYINTIAVIEQYGLDK